MNARAKRREPCVLFLDDGFGSKEAPPRFTAEGIDFVSFEQVFKTPAGKKRESVSDPDVILHCDAHRQVLLTTDKKMLYQSGAVIAMTQVAIIAIESNQDEPEVWIAAIIKAKARIERFARKCPRPSFGFLGKNGKINRVIHVTQDWLARGGTDGQRRTA